MRFDTASYTSDGRYCGERQVGGWIWRGPLGAGPSNTAKHGVLRSLGDTGNKEGKDHDGLRGDSRLLRVVGQADVTGALGPVRSGVTESAG